MRTCIFDHLVAEELSETLCGTNRCRLLSPVLGQSLGH